jgi:integrase
MSVYKRGGSYQANFMLQGVRYRATFKTEQEARLWEQSVRTSVALGRPIGEPASPSGVATLIDLVRHVERKHWAHKRSGASLARYAYIYADWVGRNAPVKEALEEDTIESFLTHREELGNSGSTVNRYRAGISKLVTTAIRLGVIARRPDIRVRPEGQAREKIFTEDQERLLLAVLEQWGYPDYRDLCIWLCDTGMRLGETFKLSWGDIDGHLVHIPGDITKNQKGRTIALTRRAQEVAERLRERHREGPFRWASKRALRTLWTRLRGHFGWLDETYVVHTWRHTCASRLVQNGATLDMVQRWLGHSSPMMTQRYAKYAPKNLEQLASILDNLRDAA